MKRTADINEILRPLKDAPCQAYLSNAVQVADILEWILSQVGVAEIWQTSFSISEEFLRRLYFICKDKVEPHQPCSRPQGYEQDAQTLGVHQPSD